MHLLYKLTFAGMEVGVVKLANGFDRARIEPSICSCRPAEPIKEKLRNDVVLFEMDRRRSGNDPAFVLKLARLLRRHRPDILHTHSWGTLCEGAVAARLASVPLVVHGEHGTLQTSHRVLIAQRFVWNRVDRVVSVSERLTERMAETVGFPIGRIRTILNGVDSERFTPDRRASARAALGLTPRDFVVGTVGRLEPVKDQHTLIEALGALARRGVRFTAYIVGDGALREDLGRHASQLGVADHVVFPGRRVDVEDVMASFDVFALSSRSEGLSNTILEAMATGLPVVSTDVGGARELVVEGITGLLVPPADSESLASAIASLAEDPDGRLAMGQSGRLRATSHFSLSGMIRQYEDLYLELAARPVRETRRVGALRLLFR
jgi:sugar transferase (PEP-CTERM/EpsH1 system associated)